MIAAFLQPDGTLTDISSRQPGPGDVELDEMPAGYGPFKQDPVNPRKAIPAMDATVWKLLQDKLQAKSEAQNNRALAAALWVIWSRLKTPVPGETFVQFLQAIGARIDATN